jgi:hypothetical protein
MLEQTIPLTAEQYHELEKAMQWPEDMAAYEKLNAPTPLFDTVRG